MMDIKEIMQQLIDYSYDRMLNKGVYPFCAFLVKDGVIISKGFNEGLFDYGNKTIHGEMVAIKKACKSLLNLYLDRCVLFTTCEPCLACFDTALWVHIKHIVYSVDHKDFPEYFNDHPYTIDKYIKENPGSIKISKYILHNEGIQLFKSAKKKHGW
jgi:guanine deaminase